MNSFFCKWVVILCGVNVILLPITMAGCTEKPAIEEAGVPQKDDTVGGLLQNRPTPEPALDASIYSPDPSAHPALPSPSNSQSEDTFASDILIVLKKNDTQDYDPLYTMHTINAFVGSLSNVIETGDRIILDQEYHSILNNLKIGNIEADRELISLYQEHMDMITSKTLRQEERERFQAVFEKKKNRGLWEAIGGIRAYGADPATFALSLAQNSVSAFFNYKKISGEVREELDNELWQLRQDEISDLNDIRKEFLNAAWTLLRKYGLPDELRITEEVLSQYLQASVDPDRERAVRIFDRLKEHFGAYPPFWYFYGMAAQESDNTQLALKCYNTFEDIHRDIFRRDPYYARIALNKSLLLIQNGDEEQIERLLGIAEKHSEPTDGMNFLTIAMIYFESGKVDKAKEILQINLDNKVDVSITKIAFSNLEQGRPIQNGVPQLVSIQIETDDSSDEWEGVDIDELRKIAEQGIPEAQLALYGRLIETDKLESMKWLQSAAEQDYAIAQALLGLDYLKNNEHDEAYKWLSQAETQNNPYAHFGLGVLYTSPNSKYTDEKKGIQYFQKGANLKNYLAMYYLGLHLMEGEGIESDKELAEHWLTAAAQQGHKDVQYQLGKYLLDGAFGDERCNEGLPWLRKSAEAGNIEAVLDYLFYVYNDDNNQMQAEKDYATSLLKKNANSGDESCIYCLACYYCSGSFGVSIDLNRAKELFDKLAQGESFVMQSIVLASLFLNEQKKTSNVDLWPVSAERISSIKSYAVIPDGEDIVFAWDDTYMDNFSKGFCFTETRAYSSDLGDKEGILLKEIDSVGIMEVKRPSLFGNVVSVAVSPVVGFAFTKSHYIFLNGRQFYQCPHDIDCAEVVSMIEELAQSAKRN